MATYHQYYLFLQAYMIIIIILCYCISVGISLHSTAADKSCLRRCGNMEVPYPFGTTEGCYLDRTFQVSCNASTNTVYGLNGAMEFLSVPDHTAGFRDIPFGVQSFNRSGDGYFSHIYFNLRVGNMRVSPSRNTFVAIGCDFYAYVIDDVAKQFVGGCASLCDRADIAPSNHSSCSGLGCCQFNLPENATYLSIWIQSMNTETRLWTDTCAFYNMVSMDSFSFDGARITNCSQPYQHSGIVEWVVSNMSCPDAKKNMQDYACGHHTSCHNSTFGEGYQCKCLSGYNGNPYLLDGCQDIDECKGLEGNKCPPNTYCNNTLGSYHCLPNRTHGATLTLAIILGTSLALGILILVLVSLWLHRHVKKMADRKLKLQCFKRNGGLLLQQQVSSSLGSVLLESKLFKAEELDKATDNFSESRILGRGGLGTVYKGMLLDGTIVAVKIANVVDESQVAQFINEVFILSEIKHRHIIKLLGCCLETQVPRLVYEYVSNGTLHEHLHNFSDSIISWENRLRIAAEVAGALAYLHSCASTAIIHRDMKTSNILLDEKYCAVVSDFGLSRSVSIDKTHLTTVVGGTFGYLDPEYFRSGQLTDKSDVYSFGVILAELLTGRKPTSSIGDKGGLVLAFQTALEENCLSEILDKIVANECKEEEIYAAAQLCDRCLQLDSRKRPCMKDVAAELDRIRRTDQPFTHEDSFCSESPAISDRCYIDDDYEAEDYPILPLSSSQ